MPGRTSRAPADAKVLVASLRSLHPDRIGQVLGQRTLQRREASSQVGNRPADLLERCGVSFDSGRLQGVQHADHGTEARAARDENQRALGIAHKEASERPGGQQALGRNIRR